MGVNLRQTGAGNLAFANDSDSTEDLEIGGPKTPITGSSTSMRLMAERVAKFSVAGGTDTGGGILSWANPKPYSILLTRVQLDVLTASTTACTISVGTTAASATTAVTNALATANMTTVGQVASTNCALKVASGAWITMSQLAGVSAGMTGNLYLTHIPA